MLHGEHAIVPIFATWNTSAFMFLQEAVRAESSADVQPVDALEQIDRRDAEGYEVLCAFFWSFGQMY